MDTIANIFGCVAAIALIAGIPILLALVFAWKRSITAERRAARERLYERAGMHSGRTVREG